MEKWRGGRADRIGSGRTAIIGGLIAAAGTVPFLFLGAQTPYWWLCVVALVRGAGISLCMNASMAAVYRAIPPAKISDGTTQNNVLNRLGGSTGTALFTVIVQHSLAGATTIYSHTFGGGAVSINATALNFATNFAGGTNTATWNTVSNGPTAWLYQDGTVTRWLQQSTDFFMANAGVKDFTPAASYFDTSLYEQTVA